MSPNKISVAIVIPAFNIGGMETSMLRIGNFLQASGYDVSIICTNNKGEWFDRISESGLRAIVLDGISKSLPFWHSYRVGNYLKKQGFKIIFTVFDPWSMASLSLIPDSVVVVPLLRNDHPDVYRIGLANKSRWNVAVGNSDKIVIEAKKYVGDKPVRVIYNGVQIPQNSSSKLSPGMLSVAFVGRLVNESKGIFLLPVIVRQCLNEGINVTLTIAGDGPDLSELQKLIDDEGVKENVRFLGMIESNAVTDLLTSSNVLLFTSYYEGLPNVVIEAQACGCIPIVSRLPGITDIIVKHSETGFLASPGNVQEYVNCFKAIYSNPDKCHEISRNAREYVIKNFSIEKERDQFCNLLSDALKNEYPLSNERKSFFPLDKGLFPSTIEQIRLFLYKLKRKLFRK